MDTTCKELYLSGDFKDHDDFVKCYGVINDAVARGVLNGISQPGWFSQPKEDMGPALYFECVGDGSIWILVAPERAFRGYWKKIRSAKV